MLRSLHRPIVGVSALVLLALGIGIPMFGTDASWAVQLSGAGLRIGGVLAVLWLALPELQQARPRWWLGLIVVLALVVLMSPRRVPAARLIPWIAIAVVALLVLRPRRRQPRGDNSRL